MSKLAQKIHATEPATGHPVRRGPENQCFPIYGFGDLEDWEAMEARRINGKGMTWAEVQVYIDGLAGVQKPIRLDKFKHHWRRFCWCWPEELRRGR